jgi:hypothetical protein
MEPPPPPVAIEARLAPPENDRREVVIAGSAGQRIVTAGEILCLSGITAGLHVTQKNDYPITVLRGHSVSELILAPDRIDYTGIQTPDVVIALAPEGVARRQGLIAALPAASLVLAVRGLDLPPTAAEVVDIDFKAEGLRPPDWALASLARLAAKNRVLSREMLDAAVDIRFSGDMSAAVHALVARVADG